MKKTSTIILTMLSIMLVSCGKSSTTPSPDTTGDTNTTITNTNTGSSTTSTPVDLNVPYEVGNAVSKCTKKEVKTYYSDIDPYFDGDEFLGELRRLNSDKLKNRVGYDRMWDYYGKTDYYSEPFSGTSKQFSAYYTGKSASRSAMNKEHVWPASRTVGGRGSDPLEDDIHMVRPTVIADNSDRGNDLFAEEGAWDPASLGNPQYRGDAARIIFYCVITDSRLSLIDVPVISSATHQMGKLSDLLKWNLAYPVSQTEMNRNDGIYLNTPQKNRNPFIDSPSYACKIWGGTNDETRKICGMN